MEMVELLHDKVIIIVGGTKGIGKGIAFEAARQGATVVIGGRDSVAGNMVVERIEEENGKAEFIAIDVRDIVQCKKIFDITMQKYGKVDGYVHYSGITTIASIEDCDEVVFDDIFDTNVKGTIFCVQNAINNMKKNNGGSILIFGSPHDDKGEKDRGVYACSKSTLSALVTHVAKHYSCDGIRINYITTGWTPTEGELAFRKQNGMNEEELRNYASTFIPMGRMQEVEDHVPAAIYLLSDMSSMVTGSNVRVTGGLFF